MKHLAFTTDCFKILTIFSSSPGSRWQRKDLQEYTRLSNVLLDNALKRLLASKLLLKENRLYQLNHQESKEIIKIIREEYLRLRELPFPVYFALLDLQERISHDLELFLFGSYAKLVYKEGSDLDIAVLHGKKYRRVSVEKIEAKYGISIELHEFEKAAFLKNKRDPLVKEILKNGIKL